MRMLVKFACVAVFLMGCMSKAHTMIIMFDKDEKPIPPNYALLCTKDFLDRNRSRLAKADAQLKSGRIDSNVLDTSPTSDIGSRQVSAILAQTQAASNITQAQPLISIAPPERLQTTYDAYLRLKALNRLNQPISFSPDEKQILKEECQALLAQIAAMPNKDYLEWPVSF